MQRVVVCVALVAALGCSKSDGSAEKQGDKPGPKPAPTVEVAECTGADCVLAVDDQVQKMASLHLAKNSVQVVRRHRHHPVEALAMDHLIARALLLQDAKKHGLTMTMDEANKAVSQGKLILLGLLVDGKNNYFRDGVFDVKLLQAIVKQHLKMPSLNTFMAEQRLEQLAYKASQRRADAVEVSAKDVRDYYKRFHTTATLELVKYPAHEFLATAVPTPAQVAAYIKQHEDKVRARFEQNRQRYRGVSKQVRMRHIFVKRRKPGSKGTADPGYGVAKAIHAKLQSGTDFATLAKTTSEDVRTRPRGGDAGWRNRDHLGYGVELVKAVADLPLNNVSPVISTPRGFHIVRFEGERSGDLSYEQVRDEIAAKLANHELAIEHATARAEAARAKLAAGTKPEELFNEHREGGVPKLPIAQIKQLAAQGKIDAAMLKKLMAAHKPRPKPKFDARGKRLPELLSVGPFRRDKFIPGLPGGRTAVELVFDKAALGQWTVTTVGADAYLLRVTKRTAPDWNKFESDKAELEKFLKRTRGAEAVDAWVVETCKKRRDAKRIRVNKLYAKLRNAKGKMEPYVPCVTLKPDRH